MDPLTAASWAKGERVPIYTIAFGTPDGTVNAGPYGQPVPVPPDPATLHAIADTTGGEFFQAPDAATLRKVYGHIGTRVGVTKERKEITYAFAAAGALLLLAAGAAGTLGRSALA
jgi:Ca-activated chloride channel family protein